MHNEGSRSRSLFNFFVVIVLGSCTIGYTYVSRVMVMPHIESQVGGTTTLPSSDDISGGADVDNHVMDPRFHDNI